MTGRELFLQKGLEAHAKELPKDVLAKCIERAEAEGMGLEEQFRMVEAECMKLYKEPPRSAAPGLLPARDILPRRPIRAAKDCAAGDCP